VIRSNGQEALEHGRGQHGDETLGARRRFGPENPSDALSTVVRSLAYLDLCQIHRRFKRPG